jgi:hypothetical protein
MKHGLYRGQPRVSSLSRSMDYVLFVWQARTSRTGFVYLASRGMEPMLTTKVSVTRSSGTGRALTILVIYLSFLKSIPNVESSETSNFFFSLCRAIDKQQSKGAA